MNRRSFFASLAALPIVGKFVKPGLDNPEVEKMVVGEQFWNVNGYSDMTDAVAANAITTDGATFFYTYDEFPIDVTLCADLNAIKFEVFECEIENQ